MRSTTARNSRKYFYKYYKVDDTKQYAVLAGRCTKCLRITDIFCDNCFEHVCEKHVFHNEVEYSCDECKGDEAVPLSKQEIRKIRKGELRI